MNGTITSIHFLPVYGALFFIKMWRKNLLKLESQIDFSNYRERDFDFWFLSRYFLSETIRLAINNLETNIHSTSPTRVNVFKLSQLSFIWQLQKKKIWIFPHGRTINPTTGIDEYVYPHLSDLDITESINVGHTSGKTFNLNKVVRIVAKFMTFLPFVGASNFQNSILVRYTHAFNLRRDCTKVISRHASHQYAMYKIYNFLLRLYKPSKIHFSDRSDKFPLILACKKQKIQMIEYQHGLPLELKFNYDFGDFNKELFSHITFKYCYPNKRYTAVLSRLGMKLKLVNSRISKVKNNTISKNRGPKNILIVMQSDFFNTVSGISFDRYSHLQFYIKPHPSENIHQYSDLGRYSNIEILPSSSEAFYEFLPSADIVVGFYSTALVESSILGKRCIAISEYDELTEQMAAIFNIVQLRKADFISELAKWR